MLPKAGTQPTTGHPMSTLHGRAMLALEWSSRNGFSHGSATQSRSPFPIFPAAILELETLRLPRHQGLILSAWGTRMRGFFFFVSRADRVVGSTSIVRDQASSGNEASTNQLRTSHYQTQRIYYRLLSIRVRCSVSMLFIMRKIRRHPARCLRYVPSGLTGYTSTCLPSSGSRTTLFTTR
jgi:hypothetical protein